MFRFIWLVLASPDISIFESTSRNYILGSAGLINCVAFVTVGVNNDRPDYEPITMFLVCFLPFVCSKKTCCLLGGKYNHMMRNRDNHSELAANNQALYIY